MYGVQMLITVVSVFIEITSHLYYGKSIMLCGREVSTELLYVFNVLLPILFALHLGELFSITGSSSSTSGEANRSAFLLQKLLLVLELHADALSEIHLFLKQAIHQKVRFPACDFLLIIYKVSSSVVGAVTTLLVLLVKFQTSA
jgi:hypothetical protein